MYVLASDNSLIPTLLVGNVVNTFMRGHDTGGGEDGWQQL
jgi:hypothetical protein